MSDDRLRSLIRDIPDFPKPGIVFKDITPLMADAAALAQAVHELAAYARPLGVDCVVAAEARGFLVLPSVKTYVAFPMPPLMAELDAPDLVSAPEGEATVAGIKTTKYRIDHTAADGSRAEGHLWVSRADILMKLEVTVTRPEGHKPTAIAMELSHVEIGAVDPGLFALPDGMVELPAEALGPLLGARPK